LRAPTNDQGDGPIDGQRSTWLESVRRQFVRIASRRVDADDVEDVVQEALGIIAEKGIHGGIDLVDDGPPLASCFQVLRNVIGNHYQRSRTRSRWTTTDADAVDRAPGGDFLESMSSQETLAVVEATLEEMARSDAACAGYLSRMADGARARKIAEEARIEVTAFYRRLYRCRQKLRALLRDRGIEA
jgi:DNA-directed RNA polymerase specialized sigma24 family protein